MSLTMAGVLDNIEYDRCWSESKFLKMACEFLDHQKLAEKFYDWLEPKVEEDREEKEEEGVGYGQDWAETADMDQLARLTGLDTQNLLFWYSSFYYEAVANALRFGAEQAERWLDTMDGGLTGKQIEQAWAKMLDIDPKRERDKLLNRCWDGSFIHGFVQGALDVYEKRRAATGGRKRSGSNRSKQTSTRVSGRVTPPGARAAAR